MARTILLKGEHIRKEMVATGAILPGHFVGVAGAVSASGAPRRAVALENDLVGKGIDDAYASGQTVQVGCLPPGAEVNAILATSQTIAVGAALQTNANGELIALAAGVQVAIALQAVTTTGATARIVVEIL